MTVKKICCIGLGHAGVSICAVIAAKCPEIKVTLVHSSAEQVFLWNAKQIPALNLGTGYSDYIRKCHNKNLFFTTNSNVSINEADIIFIVSDSKLKCYGEGKEQVVDLTQIQEAAYLIAGQAESSKIIVENSGIPYKTTDCVKEILNKNRHPGVEFQVLSNPTFYDEGKSFCSILSPDCVLIGSDDTVKGAAAAKELSVVYERWIDPGKLYIGNNRTVELGKLCMRAMVAQRLTNVLALAPICEKLGANIVDVIGISAEDRIGFHPTHIPCQFEDFSGVLSTLIYMSGLVKLHQLRDYWTATTEMMVYHSREYISRLMRILNGNLRNKKIALFGFSCNTEGNTTKGSVAIDISKHILDEGGILTIYEPRMNKSEAVEFLADVCNHTSKEDLEKLLVVSDDPRQAVSDCEGVIICVNRPEFINADFVSIYKVMLKPAFLFDYVNLLPHENLLKIGFRVFTTGKRIKNQ